MSADKLRNLAKIPGMGVNIGDDGVKLLNDIADSYSDMYEALEHAMCVLDPRIYAEAAAGDVRQAQALSLMKSRIKTVLAKGE